jgi:hypothetical protein
VSVLFDIYGVTDSDLIYLEGIFPCLSLNAATLLLRFNFLLLFYFVVVDNANDLLLMIFMLLLWKIELSNVDKLKIN